VAPLPVEALLSMHSLSPSQNPEQTVLTSDLRDLEALAEHAQRVRVERV